MRVLTVNTVTTGKNGITNVILNLYQAMDKQDFEFGYVSINEPDTVYVKKIEAHGGQVFVLPRSIRGALSYVCKLRKLLRQGKYDIIHAHGNSSTLVLEMLAAKLANCKVRIAHSHNTACSSVKVHKLLNPLFQKCCTHRLACGKDAGKWLYNTRSFLVVNNGVDTARFAFRADARQRVRDNYGFREDQIVIGHVGIFNDAKNQAFLVEVLEALVRENKNYRLLLIGEGPLRQSVEKKAEEMGLTKYIVFAGVTDQVSEHLSACDLIVMPSLFEGLPLSLIEEQANGLRCIVSTDITNEVDKSGNVTFLPLEKGASSWAQIIQQMPKETHRQEMSWNAIEKIKACGYDIYTEAEKLKEYYRNAIGAED